jgi:hypothetical protein
MIDKVKHETTNSLFVIIKLIIKEKNQVDSFSTFLNEELDTSYRAISRIKFNLPMGQSETFKTPIIWDII